MEIPSQVSRKLPLDAESLQEFPRLNLYQPTDFHFQIEKVGWEVKNNLLEASSQSPALI